MSHWLLDKLGDTRQHALKLVSRAQIYHELLNLPFSEDAQVIRRCAEALELAVLDLTLEDIKDDEEKRKDLKQAAADAFRMLRVLPRPTDAMKSAVFLLRAGALAVVGDKGPDAARWLREERWPDLPLESDDWSKRTWATILDIWLLLIRKNGWTDRDFVLERIDHLRDCQSSFEKDFLERLELAQAKTTALELIGLYHLAKAAEIFATYMTEGEVDGNFQIHQLLETHFDRVLAVCKQAKMVELEPLSRLLAASASQMAENSWPDRGRGLSKGLASAGRD